MPAQPEPSFEFIDDLTGFRAPGWLVVRLPGQLRRKQDILRALSRGLKFPDYFGWNWDAVEECLRDLSWLDVKAGVVLLHEHWPLRDSKQRGVYLDLLVDAQASQHIPLRVVFPRLDNES